jgi:magnesium transporter
LSSPGGKAFLDSLLPRLNPRNINGGPAMPFQLEVVEAALLSRIQRLERRLMRIEPRVGALLEVLPNRLTADVLEQLRLSKQALVELGSRAGDLKQMLIDLLDDPHEIRRICIMGRNCTLDKLSDNMECSVPLEKQIAEGMD